MTLTPNGSPGLRWEYRVIHLNVEAPAPGAAPPGSAPPGSTPSGEAKRGDIALDAPVPFSRNYLEQEFPDHYTAPSAAPDKPQHPAQQLQAFLNRLGLEGWEMLGIHPIGALTMMVFRRPLATAAPSSPPPEAPGGRVPGLEENLAAILQRLERLEANQPPPNQQPPNQQPPKLTHPISAPPLQDGDVVAPLLLQRLATRQALPTPAAAAALGFRSPASLANLGNRLGYPPGMVKRGSNGRVALYRGSANDLPRSQRLWIVLEAGELP